MPDDQRLLSIALEKSPMIGDDSDHIIKVLNDVHIHHKSPKCVGMIDDCPQSCWEDSN